MARFQFKGRGSDGQLLEGEREAASPAALAEQLMDKGVIPLQIRERKEQPNVIDQIMTRFDLYRVSVEELLMFTRQMAALSKAGIPLTRAIGGILDSLRNPLLIRVLEDSLKQLESGRPLSMAFARHPKVFSNLYVSIIQVGESTGQLDHAFAQMAGYIERNRKMNQNIKAALRYPTIVIAAIAIAMVIVNLFVIPKFAAFFEANHLELPWQTILLLNTSRFFTEYWPWLLGGLVAAWIGFRYWSGTESGRLRWHRFILRTPLFGDILLRAYLSRFARSFAMAYGAGVPIVQGMGVIARSIGNDFIGRHVAGMREGIERGDTLTRSAQRTGMFTPVVMQMFAVGEEAGNLEEMMTYIADFYEEEVDYDIKTLADRIEPLIYVLIGAMVLVLALGIFVPMWDITQLARR
jgi:MSHA biogenesis protein MshG